jgi:Trypsin
VPLAFNGKAAKSIEVPWQVAIYDNKGGTSESLSFVCGGALITKRFILTGNLYRNQSFLIFVMKNYYKFSAAHCIYNLAASPTQIPHLKLADNILVYLGKTRLHDEWTADQGVQSKSVLYFMFNQCIGKMESYL